MHEIFNVLLQSQVRDIQQVHVSDGVKHGYGERAYNVFTITVKHNYGEHAYNAFTIAAK